MTTELDTAITRAFREESGQVFATLIRVTGDWDLAEECVQEAFALALRTWPRDGVPAKPGAWLTTTARNRATDRIRREAAELTAPPEPEWDESGVHDDRLRLIFTCCHPATAGIPYRVPPSAQLPERTAAVLGMLYLLFNEGYSASAGTDLLRTDLSAEAIRPARILAGLMPGEPEVLGLLALLLLHDVRRATRVDGEGTLVSLENQDRGGWNTAEITEGTELLETALNRGVPGPYQIQAAIAACHATAARASDTDWAQIAALYGELLRFVPSPVVELNRAVAVAMAEGLEAGLGLVDKLTADGSLPGYQPRPSVLT